MVELGGKGKGKKKQEQQVVMDAIQASLEGPLDAAKVLRVNVLFQLQDLRGQMRDVMRGAASRVEVWREEVQEILAWDARGGELEMASDYERDEVSEQEEEGQEGIPEGGTPELEEPAAKKVKPEAQVIQSKRRGGSWW